MEGWAQKKVNKLLTLILKEKEAYLLAKSEFSTLSILP